MGIFWQSIPNSGGWVERIGMVLVQYIRAWNCGVIGYASSNGESCRCHIGLLFVLVESEAFECYGTLLGIYFISKLETEVSHSFWECPTFRLC